MGDATCGDPRLYVFDMLPDLAAGVPHLGYQLGGLLSDAYCHYQRMTGHQVLHPDLGQPDMVEQTRAFANWALTQIRESWFDQRQGRARPISDLIRQFESGQRPTRDGPPWAQLSQVQREQVLDRYRLALPGTEPTGSWRLRIMVCADRLLADLAGLDWPDPVRDSQRRILAELGEWAPTTSAGTELAYLVPLLRDGNIDQDAEQYWMGPVETAGGVPPDPGGIDLYIGDPRVDPSSLLRTRFCHKVLYDLGYLVSSEPFRRIHDPGYLGVFSAAESRARTTRASEIRGTHGEETFRVYLLSMTAADSTANWTDRAVVDCRDFLDRVARLVTEVRLVGSPVIEQRVLPRVISGVRHSMAQLRPDLALEQLIELTDRATSDQNGGACATVTEALVLMLAPLAPELSGRLWRQLGHPEPVLGARFPEIPEPH